MQGCQISLSKENKAPTPHRECHGQVSESVAILDNSVMWLMICLAAAQGRFLQSKHVINLECTVSISLSMRENNPLCTWEKDYGIELGDHLLAGRETCGNLIHTGQGAQDLRLSRLHIMMDYYWSSISCSSASYRRAASCVMGGTTERLFGRTSDVSSNGKPLTPCRRRTSFHLNCAAFLPVRGTRRTAPADTCRSASR